jgi:urease accessory protein UreH
MLIAQMQTLKEGVDLSAADTMLLWSLSESYVTHEQFTSRIKLYDDDRTLMYDYLIPEGTRTEVTYEALGEKKDVARFMATDPKRVERITSKLKETP